MTKITKEKYIGDNLDASPIEILEETIETDNDDRIFELEKHLHEQYAINNNSNSDILISLISALLISFTGYGYVLYQYCIGECDNVRLINLAAIMVMSVMVLLNCISVNLGSGQRMEQFITIAIRKKAYGSNTDKYKEIFPDGYHPFNKDFCSFVQGIYNTWSIATQLAILGIGSSHLIILDCNIVCPVIISVAICIGICIVYRCCKYKKYKEREKACIEKFKHFLHDITDDRKYFSFCNVVCSIVVATFTMLSVWIICTFCMCKNSGDDDRAKQEKCLNIKVEESSQIKVQIID